MQYSKRRKNLGGGRKKRSNRKSYKSVMSGGSSPDIQQNVIWQWRHDSGFMPYSESDNIIIEQAYQQNPHQILQININSNVMKLNFDKMTQYNVNTQGERRIKRLPINVDELCNLIYRNIRLTSPQFEDYWHYYDATEDHKGLPSTFTITPAQRVILNGISGRNMTPLYTACRSNSSTELIQFLINNTTNLNYPCGLDLNTAAHGVTYSDKSIDDKIKILRMFYDSGRVDFSLLNKKKESVADMLYELENNKLKLLINRLPFRKRLLFNKHIESILPNLWVREVDRTSNNFYYRNTETNHTQWEEPMYSYR